MRGTAMAYAHFVYVVRDINHETICLTDNRDEAKNVFDLYSTFAHFTRLPLTLTMDWANRAYHLMDIDDVEKAGKHPSTRYF